MTPFDAAEVMEAAGRLAALVGRSLPKDQVDAAAAMAADPEDAALLAGLAAMVRHHLDHVPNAVEGFAHLLAPSMSDKRPCRT